MFLELNAHTYFLRQKSCTLSAHLLYFASCSVCACVVSAMHGTSFIILTLSEPWKLFLILVIKFMKGSSIQNWWYPMALFCQSIQSLHQTSCSRMQWSLPLMSSLIRAGSKLMITLSFAFPSSLGVYFGVSTTAVLTDREMESSLTISSRGYFCGLLVSSGIWY